MEGRGRFLLPGLIDMHVHLRRAHVEEYVRHGIMSVRNMWGTPEVESLIEEIERGRLLGPAI